MTVTAAGVSAHWLSLREPADRRGRSAELAGILAAGLGVAAHAEQAAGSADPIRIHDLGCGTGSLGRWLAPLLPGDQQWVLHDRESASLAAAVADPPRHSDGTAVQVTVLERDLTRLTATDLAGADVIAASALLDLLDAAELARLVDAIVTVGCPALLTMTVTGSVRLDPPDPQDAAVEAAFNAHQRRHVDGRRLLGPDATGVAVAAFRRAGWRVRTRSSSWRLGVTDADLLTAWLIGRVAAASEQNPVLARADSYLARRITLAAAGGLRAVVGHVDLLATPR